MGDDVPLELEHSVCKEVQYNAVVYMARAKCSHEVYFGANYLEPHEDIKGELLKKLFNHLKIHYDGNLSGDAEYK